MKGWLWLTLLLLPALLAAVWGIGTKGLELLTEREALIAAGTAWLASSAGWLIILRGLRFDPGAIATIFGLGLVVKLLLLGAGVAVAIGLLGAPVEPFAIATVSAFVFASFVQMIPVSRVALATPAPGGGE